MSSYPVSKVGSIAALEEELRHIETERMRLAQHEVRVRERIDEIRLAERPSYPTEEQKVGIRAAVQAINQRVEPESHLGDWVAPLVKVNGTSGWIQVRTGAPYSSARRSQKLWGLEPAEVDTILTLVRALGYEIDKHWLNDGNLSLTVQL